MPLPGTARFAKTDESGTLKEFDSVGFLVSYHRDNSLAGDTDSQKVHFSLRLGTRDMARLQWLSDDLGVARSTLARQLLGAALVEALDSMNITEDTKHVVQEEIDDIEHGYRGPVS
jgi:hypothetical protein